MSILGKFWNSFLRFIGYVRWIEDMDVFIARAKEEHCEAIHLRTQSASIPLLIGGSDSVLNSVFVFEASVVAILPAGPAIGYHKARNVAVSERPLLPTVENAIRKIKLAANAMAATVRQELPTTPLTVRHAPEYARIA